MRLIPTFIAVFGLAGIPAALAQGCCGGQGGMQPGCNMAGHTATGGHEGHSAMQAPDGQASVQASSARHVLMKPVQEVFDDYMKVQGTLAQDSLEGIGSTAAEMAKVIRGDTLKRLSPRVAEQADALAKAQDLESARAAFKTLSESLIDYLQSQKAPAGAYYVAYCPMAKASWVQTDKTIMNPYMGKQMIHCGQIKG